jgi:limonene-1,2-epoxide hydrolase
MSASSEATVLAFLEALHSSEVPDLVKALTVFADDARYQVCVPRGELLVGREAILAELKRQFAFYHHCECEILALASNDHQVFTERRDHVTITDLDRRIFSSVCAVFELDQDGRVVNWREYWDTDDINQQLGLTPEQAAELHGAHR